MMSVAHITILKLFHSLGLVLINTEKLVGRQSYSILSIISEDFQHLISRLNKEPLL